MNKPFITLAKYNTDGIVASIENDDMDTVDIYLNRRSNDVESACRAAAKRLRLLADAYDCLATMEKPFNESTQRKAIKAAKEVRTEDFAYDCFVKDYK